MTGIQEKEQYQLHKLESGHDFEVPRRFQIIKEIGQGGFGIICSGSDICGRPNQYIAIKKIPDCFRNAHCSLQAVRELRLMYALRHHPKICKLLDIIDKPPHHVIWKDLYFVMELMDGDLKEILQKRRFCARNTQYIIKQLVQGIKSVHKLGYFHGDLKPENLFVKISGSKLRIGDFGLCQPLKTGNLNNITVTRWYRSPELIFASLFRSTLPSSSFLSTQTHHDGVSYLGEKVDMWSIGCILAEMLNSGSVVFPGSDACNQIELISKLIGSPSEADIEWMGPELKHFTLEWMKQRGIREPPINFESAFPHPFWPSQFVRPFRDDELILQHTQALDLLGHLLKYNLRERYSADQALQHPYLRDDYQSDSDFNDDELVPLNDDDMDDSASSSIDLYQAHLRQLMRQLKQ